MRFQSHISLHKLSKKLDSYPKALVFLSRMHDLPMVEQSGVKWINEADVPRFVAAWTEWRNRPRLYARKKEPYKRRRRTVDRGQPKS